MNSGRRPAEWAALERTLGRTTPQPFRVSDLARAEDAVRRYFAAGIADGTSLADGARLRMRGSIKLGRWLPFRAEQLLAPRHGTVWAARVGCVITGSDRYLEGRGSMAWRIFGALPLMHANGHDVSRSTRGRVAAESIWVPTALAGQMPIQARALGANRLAVDVVVDGETIVVEHALADDGRVLSSRLERWGDPDGSGEFRPVPFGVEATQWRTFNGVSIPSAGRAGWYHGAEKWATGESVRYEITEYALVSGRDNYTTV